MKHFSFVPTLSLLLFYNSLWKNTCSAEDSVNYYGERAVEEDAKVISSVSNRYTSKQLFDMLDIDRNSKISLKDIYIIDKNHDGDISWSEIAEILGSPSYKEANEPTGFMNAFTSSTAMIIATEIGDKTFFIAAVLSMRNPRIVVFGGAIFALICMTVLR